LPDLGRFRVSRGRWIAGRSRNKCPAAYPRAVHAASPDSFRAAGTVVTDRTWADTGHGGRAERSDVTMNNHRILVAFDGSEESFRALEQAADVAMRRDAQVGIVTVLPPLVDAPRDALRYLRDHGLEATVHVPVGDPATEIARVADDGSYHTVYLGTRDSEIEGALDPSVARAVADTSPTNVFIAR
jgi:nucleotide-binding universal stress UspA family protein